MRKIYFLFFLFPLFSIAQKLEGQPLIDSLLVELPKMKEDTVKVKILIELSSKYKDIDPKIGVKYADKSLYLSKKINWQYGITTSYGVKAINQTWMAEYDNALSNYNLALKNKPNKKTLSRIYRGIGIVYLSQSNYPKALEFNNKALKLFEERNDKEGISSILSNNGNIYTEMHDYKKGIENFNKALIINEKINEKNYIAINLQNIASCYYKLDQNQNAILYYNKALRVANSIGDKSSEAGVFQNLALVYKDMKLYDKALQYQEKAYIINKSSGFESDMAFNIGGIGRIFLEKAKIEKNNSLKNSFLNKSFDNLKTYLSYLKKNEEIKEISSCYESLSEVQKLQGKPAEALTSYEQYVIYKDSVFNSDNKETIKNLEDKREIELRDKQIKINKLALESKEKQKWFYILGLGFLGILGGLLFYQSRNRRKTNTKLQLLNENLDTKIVELDQANKTKTRFFNILNHDLRGPVSNLIDFLQIQKNTPEILDEATKNRIQDTTLSSAENLLVSMEDILLWSKGQMENFKPQPKNITVNQLFDDTKKVFSGYIKISFDYQNPENLEIFTDENYLKTIIRNLTSNAINVFTTTENPTIIWKAWQENDKKYLSVTDNGPGASSENFKALYDDTQVVGIKSGLGLHLIRDLAKAINCEIIVDSKIDIGTTFTLKI